MISYKKKKRPPLWTLIAVLTAVTGLICGIAIFNSHSSQNNITSSGNTASAIIKNGMTSENIDDKAISSARENSDKSAAALSEAVSHAKTVLSEASDSVRSDALRTLISPNGEPTEPEQQPASSTPQFGADYVPYTGAIYEIPGVMSDTSISWDKASHSHKELINHVIFDVYKAYLYAGILPSVTLAQGWLESGCFSTVGARTCHNAFGIKWKGTARAPKAQDLNPPYPTKPDGTPVLVNQLRANAYFAYFNSFLEGFVMYAADPENYYGYANSSHYKTMKNAMRSGDWKECLSGAGQSDLMKWVGTGNTSYPPKIIDLLTKHKLYLFDDEAYMVAYLKKYGIYDGESPIVIQGHTFYPGAGNYTFCSRNHVTADLSAVKTGGGAKSGEGSISIDVMGSY